MFGSAGNVDKSTSDAAVAVACSMAVVSDVVGAAALLGTMDFPDVLWRWKVFVVLRGTRMLASHSGA